MSKHHFKTEVSRLLELIIHSLYSNKEIFLRELVSNSSDAIDKLSYLGSRTRPTRDSPWEPRIEVASTSTAKTLAIVDNGVGMDEKELEENLGTIARSGTRRFLEAWPTEAKKDSNLIGQFGVGFYSRLHGRRPRRGDEPPRGRAGRQGRMPSAGRATARASTRSSRGELAALSAAIGAPTTTATGPGHRGPPPPQREGEELLSRWKLEEILKKYSNHVAYPIHLVSEENRLRRRRARRRARSMSTSR